MKHKRRSVRSGLLGFVLAGAVLQTGCEIDLSNRGLNTPDRTKRPIGFFSTGKIPEPIRPGRRRDRALDSWLRGLEAPASSRPAVSRRSPPPALATRQHRDPEIAEFPPGPGRWAGSRPVRSPATPGRGPATGRPAGPVDPGPAVRAGGTSRAIAGDLDRPLVPTPPPPEGTRRETLARAPAGPVPATGAARGTFHTVRRGETLAGLSARYGIATRDLARWNPHEVSDGLRPGMILYVPDLGRRRPAGRMMGTGTDRGTMGTGTSMRIGTDRAQGAIGPGPGSAPDRRVPPGMPPGPTRAGAPVPGSRKAPGQRVFQTRMTSRPPAPHPGASRTGSVAAVPAQPGAVSPHPDFVWPVRGDVSSPFGWRRDKPHTGIDIRAEKGTALVASQAGKVIFAGKMRGYGNTVILDHQNGYFTVYGHNQANLVRKGPAGQTTWVQKGQPIGRVGETGNATGPHLHFEIRRLNNPIDPMTLLPPMQIAMKG